MAIVDTIRGDSIELLRGVVDFYLLRGILPVARTYPIKIKPPYTPLQAEAMAVFSLASADLAKITLHMLQYWRTATEGKRKQWTDNFKGIIMHFWKLNGTIAPIATDFEIIETATEYRVKWWILQDYIDPLTPDEYYTMQTPLILKSALTAQPPPIYFTLVDDIGTRLAAPYILYNP